MLVIFHKIPIPHCRSCFWIYYGIFDFSQNEEALPSDLYFPSATPRPVNICVSSVYVQFYKMSISSCGIILDFFHLALYIVVRSYGMVGAGVLCVPTLGYGALILSTTIGGTRVSTLGGAGYLACLAEDLCSNLGGTPGLFSQD